MRPVQRLISALAVSAPILASTSATALAVWQPNGTLVCANPFDQSTPAIMPDGAGGVIIAWVDARNGFQSDIYAQRLTVTGEPAPGWPVDGVAVCVAPGGQSYAALVSDGAGGAIIAWQDARNGTDSDIYAQHITGAGVITPGWPADGLPVCIAPNFQSPPAIVTDGAGGALLAWDDYRSGTDQRDIYAQHITGSGSIALGWPVDGMGVCTAPSAQLLGPGAMVIDGAGGAIIAWTDTRNGTGLYADVYVQRVTAGGGVSPGWPVDGMALTSGFRQVNPVAASDGAGGALVVWQDASVDPEADLRATRVTGAGAIGSGWPAGGLPICVAASYQNELDVVADGAGGAFVAWTDGRNGTDSDVYLQRLSSAGGVAPGWIANGRLVSSRPAWQSHPALAHDGSGGVFVLWTWGDCCTGELTALRIAGGGGVAPGWSPAGATVRASFDAGAPVIASDLAGGAVVAWDDRRTSSAIFSDIYASRLVSDGPVPVQISLVRAEAEPGVARVTWFVASGSDLTATVYRREAATEWAAVATLSPDGSGRITHEDRDVSPGGRYGYRLGVLEAGRELYYGEAWLDIPRPGELVLEGAFPNPAPRALSVAFQLPRSSPAMLEAFDLTGRRVASREVGQLGQGRHVVDLGDALSPGLYLIVLQQGGTTLSRRAAVVR